VKRAMFLAVSMVCIVALVGVAHSEEPEWTTWEVADGGNGHEYIVLMDMARWTVQEAEAEALGGYLVTIHSQVEQTFVYLLMRAAELASPTNEDYYSIGLLQSSEGPEPAGGWYWLTGETLDESPFIKWGYNEPKGYERENFGYINTSNGTWNDGDNVRVRRAIVEREGPPPPPADEDAPECSLDAPDPAELAWSDTPTAVAISGFATDAVIGIATDAISGFAADAVSGIASASLSITDEYGELSAEQDMTGLLAADGSFAITVELASIVRPEDTDGRLYEITLNAEDNAGNAAAPASVSVLAPPDSTPPSVMLDSPQPAILSSRNPRELKTVTISGLALDDETGVASVMLTVSDEYGEFDVPEPGVSVDLGADGTFRVTLQLSSQIGRRDTDGRSYEVAVFATDLAGNVSAPCSVTIVALRPAAGNPGRGNKPDGPPGRDKPDGPPGRDKPDGPPGRNR